MSNELKEAVKELKHVYMKLYSDDPVSEVSTEIMDVVRLVEAEIGETL